MNSATNMTADVPHYLKLLNDYRGFVGWGKVGQLLFSILAGKAGLKPGGFSARAMQRWKFFQTLAQERSVKALVIGDQEFRVAYRESLPDAGQVEVALRVPFCDSSDAQVFEQIFIRKEYLQVLEWFSTILPGEKITTIMDVGANIGCTALFLSARFPAADVFCLEPEASNFARLQLNLKLNVHEKIRCFRSALFTQPGKLKLSREFRDGKEWGSRFVEDQPSENDVENSQQVDAIEIWELFEKTGFDKVDLLKMDIEGAEAGLLRDPRFKMFLKDKVRRIAVEVHEEFIKTDEAIDVLKSLNFETHVVTEFVCGIKPSAGTSSLGSALKE